MKQLVEYTTLIIGFFITINISAQPLEKIIAQHLDAIGGEDQWNDLESFEVYIENKISLEGKTRYIKKNDDKHYSRSEILGVDLIVIKDGSTVWSGVELEDGSYYLGNDEDNRENVEAIEDYTSFLRSPFLTINIENCMKEQDVKLEGRKHYVISTMDTLRVEFVSQALLVPRYFYIDKKTKYISKEEVIIPLNGIKTTTEIVYEDYRDVGGFIFPFYEKRISEGGMSQEAIVLELKINPEIDESIFEIPVDD